MSTELSVGGRQARHNADCNGDCAVSPSLADIDLFVALILSACP